MAEQILPNLYRIEIPLPASPLKALNSYLIKGPERFLLIDTGLNREECLNEMFRELDRLSVDLKKTDIFITHVHADHSGMAASLATDTSTVYFNRTEAAMFSLDNSKKEERNRKTAEIYISNGFPEHELERSVANHPGRRYALRQHLDFRILKEGDTLEMGGYCFRCIETPGHSPGHICLYEVNKKVLVAGDHILFDITPNIMFWLDMPNALKEYLASLEKVYGLDVNLVLPGHRSIMTDHKKRVRELQEHHQARLNEVLSALRDGEKTAFQVAPYITWDIDCASWELFPAAQKWFAFGETLAHLKYLTGQGTVREETKGNNVLFSLM